MSDKFTLNRTGQAPLAFTGELLAKASNRSPHGPLQNRWHEITVYRTAAGKLVAAVGFRTIWQGERDTDTVYVADSDAALVDALTKEFDPSAGWSGHPLGAHDAERKNAQLRTSIVGAYAELVSDVLSELGIAEEIE